MGGAENMERLEVEKFLMELGGFERELLTLLVIEGNEQTIEMGNVCLKELYAKLAKQKGISEKEVERKVRSGLEIMAYRGNVVLVEATFGRYHERVRVTPKRFVQIMVKKFA